MRWNDAGLASNASNHHDCTTSSELDRAAEDPGPRGDVSQSYGAQFMAGGYPGWSAVAPPEGRWLALKSSSLLATFERQGLHGTREALSGREERRRSLFDLARGKGTPVGLASSWVLRVEGRLYCLD